MLVARHWIGSVPSAHSSLRPVAARSGVSQQRNHALRGPHARLEAHG